MAQNGVDAAIKKLENPRHSRVGGFALNDEQRRISAHLKPRRPCAPTTGT
jgi:hypothetical protein